MSVYCSQHGRIYQVEFCPYCNPNEQAAVTPKADQLLRDGADAIADRADSRDTDEERSMARAVASYQGLRGTELADEADGWLFMVCLKAARACAGSFNEDDSVDGAAYFALFGEAAAQRDAQ